LGKLEKGHSVFVLGDENLEGIKSSLNKSHGNDRSADFEDKFTKSDPIEF
jgi:hypothetical protein